MRHGEACDAVVDSARPLTTEGRADIGRLAEWCAGNGVAPQKIRHSGILRAAQTAEILGARLAPSSGVRAVRGLAPGGHLTCFEVSEEFAQIAQRNLDAAGVADRVTITLGPADEHLAALPDEPHIDIA